MASRLINSLVPGRYGCNFENAYFQIKRINSYNNKNAQDNDLNHE